MPLLEGLQVPSLGQTCSFDIVKHPFLKILHNGQGHWLLISTVGTKYAEVRVYDSIYQSVNIKVKEQIASLLHTQEKEIKLKFKYRRSRVSVWYEHFVGDSRFHP